MSPIKRVFVNQTLAIPNYDKWIKSSPTQCISSDPIHVQRNVEKGGLQQKQLISLRLTAYPERSQRKTGVVPAIDLHLCWLNPPQSKKQESCVELVVELHLNVLDNRGWKFAMVSDYRESNYYLTTDKPGRAGSKKLQVGEIVEKHRDDVIENGCLRLLCTFEISCDHPQVKQVPSSCSQIFGKAYWNNDNPLGRGAMSLLESGEHCDATVKCQGVQIPCHKLVLAASSDVFRSMFSHQDTREAQSGTVEMVDAEPDAVREMVHFLYLDECKSMGEHVWQLLPLADKYNLSRLRDKCEYWLVDNLCRDNAVDILLLTDMHNSQRLSEFALEFIALNIGSVKNTAEFEQVKETRPDLMAKLVNVKLPPGSFEMKEHMSELNQFMKQQERSRRHRKRQKRC